MTLIFEGCITENLLEKRSFFFFILLILFHELTSKQTEVAVCYSSLQSLPSFYDFTSCG